MTGPDSTIRGGSTSSPNPGDGMPDRRALRILFSTYWSPTGWRSETEVQTSPEDFEYAKRAGVMFDPARLNHDEVLRRLIAARDSLSARDVVNGFITSLATRRLDARSALGSFAVFRHVKPHRLSLDGTQCGYCGMYPLSKGQEEDLNVLNFERLKWGGVRHTDPFYAMLDLELFRRQPLSEIGASDVRILRELIRAIEQSSLQTTSSNLEAVLKPLFRSNKAERDTVVAILGFCGVLETPEHPGFRRLFVPSQSRQIPERRFVDMKYPACWWRREHDINRDAIRDYFGHVL